jgi:hypothetical protein
VENLFFVSTNTFDIEKRRKQHENFVIAAKKMNVKHASHQKFPTLLSQLTWKLQIWYTSLAFGGYTSNSKAAVQQGHLMTEEMLKQ